MEILRVEQDNAGRRSCLIEGFLIDGASGAGNDGIVIIDTSKTTVRDVQVSDCPGIGIRFATVASGEFCEQHELHNIEMVQCGTGIKFDKGAGAPSFNNIGITDIWISDSTLGVEVTDGADVNRNNWDNVVVWLNNDNQKGFLFDGLVDGLRAIISVEAFSATGTTGVEFGVNMDTGTLNFDIQLYFTGTFNDEILTNEVGPSGVMWREGVSVKQTTGFGPVFMGWDESETIERFRINGDGSLQWNTPSTSTADTGRIIQGNDDPEGAVTAPVGSLFLRANGGLGTSEYNKVSGTGNTGWRPVGTGAKEEAGAVTLDWEDAVVNMESTAATRVVTLPDNAAFNGKSYLIRRDGGNTVTINRAGSDTFNGGNTAKTLDSDGAAIGIFSIGDGVWKVVATEGTVGGS